MARRRVGVVARPTSLVREQNTVVNTVVKEAWMADGTVVGRASIAGAPVWTLRVSLETTAGRKVPCNGDLRRSATSRDHRWCGCAVVCSPADRSKTNRASRTQPPFAGSTPFVRRTQGSPSLPSRFREQISISCRNAPTRQGRFGYGSNPGRIGFSSQTDEIFHGDIKILSGEP